MYTQNDAGLCLSPGLHFLPLRAAFAPTGAFASQYRFCSESRILYFRFYILDFAS